MAMNFFLVLWLGFGLLTLVAATATLKTLWHQSHSRIGWVLAVGSILAWFAVWFIVEREVRLARFYRNEAALYFALAAGLPALGGAAVTKIARAHPPIARRAAVIVSVAIWLFLAILLGFGLVCNINARCDA